MKPQLLETQDAQTLQSLGRASVQIVHDIKNQLNGLKLYATFLRKRMEKSERPADEQETVSKLIAGLDRAASGLTTLVQYGRPIELKKQSGVDVQNVMRVVSSGLTRIPTGALNRSMVIESEVGSLTGEFDPALLTDALQAISMGALKMQPHDSPGTTIKVQLRREDRQSGPTAVIEWKDVNASEVDPFQSFAGSEAIRMSLAAKIVEAHGGEAQHEGNLLRVRLPLSQ
jgi:signal transduction histidine kinase